MSDKNEFIRDLMHLMLLSLNWMLIKHQHGNIERIASNNE
jgi:hypothetical protein